MKDEYFKELFDEIEAECLKTSRRIEEIEIQITVLKLHENETKEVINLSRFFTAGAFLSETVRREPVLAIAEALKINKTLRSLDLSCNGIDDKGVQPLAKALKINQTLEELNLIGNNIDHIGIESITSVFEENTTLRNVYLNGSPQCEIIDHCLRLNREYQRFLLLEMLQEALTMMPSVLITLILNYNYEEKNRENSEGNKKSIFSFTLIDKDSKTVAMNLIHRIFKQTCWKPQKENTWKVPLNQFDNQILLRYKLCLSDGIMQIFSRWQESKAAAHINMHGNLVLSDVSEILLEKLAITVVDLLSKEIKHARTWSRRFSNLFITPHFGQRVRTIEEVFNPPKNG